MKAYSTESSLSENEDLKRSIFSGKSKKGIKAPLFFPD